MRISLVAVVILLFSTVLFGCGKNTEVQGNAPAPAKTEANQADQGKKEPVTLNLGMLKYTTNAPIYIALEKGFFKEENLEVNVKWFESSNAVNVAVVSGNLEVGAVGFTADLYNMMATGQKVIIVSDKGREQKGYPFSGIFVNTESEIKSIADLKGKRAAVTTIGSTNHYMLGRVLEKYGLTTKDVQWVPMNTTSGVMESLKSKNSDVVVLSEPNASIAMKQGYAKPLTWIADEIDYQSSGIFFSPKFVPNKDAAIRFLKAYLKGARYYYEAALTQKDGKLIKGQNYDEVVKIVAKYTGQPEDVIKGSLSYIDPNGKMNVDDIKTQIEWYAKEKLISKTIDTKDIIDTSLLEEALKMLEK
jgi:NitT/TauT family transport system substrate-binding protein